MTVAATIRPEEAANRTWDALVVGAGPAGSLAARELARRGAAVLLVDKASFPRWKVCGSCLNGQALASLTSAGLESMTERLGAVPITGLLLAARGWQARIPLRDGVAVSREALDAALVEEAIRAGAAFLPQTQAVLAETGALCSVELRHDHGQHHRTQSRVVLAAHGLGGRLMAGDGAALINPRSRIGAGVIVQTAPDFYAPGTIYMACGRGGYVGLVRLEDGRLDVASALSPVKVKEGEGPGAAAAAIVASSGFPAVPGLAEAGWRGTPMLTRHAPQVAAERLFLLGDAAGYVEPFTGEGMAWALASALAVTPVVCQAIRGWQPAFAGQWERCYRQTVARRQLVCRMTAALLRHPMLTFLTIALLARVPGLATPLVRYLNTASKPGRETNHANGHC